MMPFTVLAPALFILGLCVGSFLNVVIARVPERRSIVSPGSACPRCGKPIAWFDNVPLLSYALLRARCRHCDEPISLRYPLVELLTGLLFVLAVSELGVGLSLVAGLILLAALVAITAIDLDCQLIPDVISLPGIVVGFVLSLIVGNPGWLDSLIGILVGGGLFFLIIVASRGGMGGGDMKLGAMLGAFLGWKLTLVAVLLAVLTGGVVAIILLAVRRKGRKDAVPFGPFLALGGAVSLFWGARLLEWYLGVFSG
jgi:leader peptidase (prepilin peptidase) / N-methyltransferase